MGTYTLSAQLNQIVDVSTPGVPVPNTGVTLDGANFITASPGGIMMLFGTTTSNSFQLKANAVGTTTLTVHSKNAKGVQFTDTITATVTNPTPDATDSGLTISSPHN